VGERAAAGLAYPWYGLGTAELAVAIIPAWSSQNIQPVAPQGLPHQGGGRVRARRRWPIRPSRRPRGPRHDGASQRVGRGSMWRSPPCASGRFRRRPGLILQLMRAARGARRWATSTPPFAAFQSYLALGGDSGCRLPRAGAQRRTKAAARPRRALYYAARARRGVVEARGGLPRRPELGGESRRPSRPTTRSRPASTASSAGAVLGPPRRRRRARPRASGSPSTTAAGSTCTRISAWRRGTGLRHHRRLSHHPARIR